MKIKICSSFLFLFLTVSASGQSVVNPDVRRMPDPADVRIVLPEGKGEFADVEKIGGRVLQKQGAVVERVVSEPKGGAPAALRFSGKGSVEIELPEREVKGRNDGISFHTLRVRPALAKESKALSTVVVGGARIAFRSEGFEAGSGGLAQLLAWDAWGGRKGTGEWLETGVLYPISVDGRVKMHGELAVRLDRKGKLWDLYVDDELKVGSLGLNPGGSKIVVEASGDAATTIGAIWEGEENPLFVDVDRDGRRDGKLGAKKD